MTALIEQLFRLKLKSALVGEDAVGRERRIAEVRMLLAEIAVPRPDVAPVEALRPDHAEEAQGSFADAA